MRDAPDCKGGPLFIIAASSREEIISRRQLIRFSVACSFRARHPSVEAPSVFRFVFKRFDLFPMNRIMTGAGLLSLVRDISGKILRSICARGCGVIAPVAMALPMVISPAGKHRQNSSAAVVVMAADVEARVRL